VRFELLSLLENPEVRRLVATWPNVTGKTEMHRTMIWSALSGVPVPMVRRWYKPLLQNKIVREDMSIDEIAAEYIATVALSQARAKRAK
jgi:hypothetical protein